MRRDDRECVAKVRGEQVEKLSSFLEIQACPERGLEGGGALSTGGLGQRRCAGLQTRARLYIAGIAYRLAYTERWRVQRKRNGRDASRT